MITTVGLVIAFVGIDVAKAKLDVVLRLGEQMTHRVFANDATGFEQLVTWRREASLAEGMHQLSLTKQGGSFLSHGMDVLDI